MTGRQKSIKMFLTFAFFPKGGEIFNDLNFEGNKFILGTAAEPECSGEC